MRVKTQYPEAFLMTLRDREFSGRMPLASPISALVWLTETPSAGLGCETSVQSPTFHVPLVRGIVASHEPERPCAYFSSPLLLYSPAVLSTNRAELSPGEGETLGRPLWLDKATCGEMHEDNDTHYLDETMEQGWRS